MQLSHKPKDKALNQALWLMPVIPALWEAKLGWPLELKSFQPGQQGETPSLQKIQKPSEHGGAHLQSQQLRRLRLESGRQRLQWAKIALLQFSLGDRMRPCFKTKEKQKQCRPSLSMFFKKTFKKNLVCFPFEIISIIPKVLVRRRGKFLLFPQALLLFLFFGLFFVLSILIFYNAFLNVQGFFCSHCKAGHWVSFGV